ncbi:hypothetical protein [Tolypothrix sp. VBCCA 56010]|uniref:hypothetical protein n=1 Tax=Tolypothrix sp. VBCCA 56010 TaxID=3137731 RepID=UPI003D7E09F7
MQVAFEKIQGEHPSIIAAKMYLGLAIEYANRYHQKQWSIYWNTAKTSTKKALRQELKSLAFDAYTAFLKATDCLNAYVEVVQACQPVPPVPRWWDEMLVSLYLAHDAMRKEHGQEISSKQLSLFEEHDLPFL